MRVIVTAPNYNYGSFDVSFPGARNFQKSLLRASMGVVIYNPDSDICS